MSWNKERRKAYILDQYRKNDPPFNLLQSLLSVQMPSTYSPSNQASYMYKDKNETYPNQVTISVQMDALGYGRISPSVLAENNELSRRCCYILDERITPPKALYGYHGTSGAFHTSVQQNGLDSGRNIMVNPGAMETQSNEGNGFCYSTSCHLPQSFAVGTVEKINRDVEGTFKSEIKSKVPLFNEKNNGTVLYRFRLDHPENHDKVGVQPPTSAAKLDMSIDGGKNWYPADKFTLEKTATGKIAIVPDYSHKEIQEMDALLVKQSKSLFQKFIDVVKPSDPLVELPKSEDDEKIKEGKKEESFKGHSIVTYRDKKTPDVKMKEDFSSAHARNMSGNDGHDLTDSGEQMKLIKANLKQIKSSEKAEKENDIVGVNRIHYHPK